MIQKDLSVGFCTFIFKIVPAWGILKIRKHRPFFFPFHWGAGEDNNCIINIGISKQAPSCKNSPR